MDAVRYHIEQMQGSPEDVPEDGAPVTACQVWISVGVLRTPLAAQGTSYEQQCSKHHKTAPHLAPLSRSSSKTHYKIAASMADVLFHDDRAAVLRGLRCVGLVEDCWQ